MTWTATCRQLAQLQETSDSVSVWLARHLAWHLVFLYIPRSPLLLTPHVPLKRFLVPHFTWSPAPYVIPHPLLCSIPCLSRDSVLHILRDPLPLAVTDIFCRVGLSLLRSRFLECHATWGTLCHIPKSSCAGHSAVLALATTFNTMLYLQDASFPCLFRSTMEQPENKEEVIKGDIDLQSLHLGKTVHRRCAELVKTADGKNDGNTANKKGNTKNRKSAVEQSAMVRKNNVTNNKSVQSWYLFICLLLWTRKLQMLIVSVVFPWTLWTDSYGEGEWEGAGGIFDPYEFFSC